MEASTPSPVYFDVRACRFRRHRLWGDAAAEAAEAGSSGDAQADAAPPLVVTEDEASLALAVQLSLDEPQTQTAFYASRAAADGAPPAPPQPAEAAPAATEHCE